MQATQRESQGFLLSLRPVPSNREAHLHKDLGNGRVSCSDGRSHENNECKSLDLHVKPQRQQKVFQIDSMQEVELRAKNGPIWATRPKVTSTGLLSMIWNRKHRATATAAPVFRDVAFAPAGLALATIDARGHVVHYNLLQNRYYHVKHAGAAGVRIVYHPRKVDEVLVAVDDGTVSCLPFSVVLLRFSRFYGAFTQIRCYCVTNGELLAMLSGHKQAPTSMSFDSSGGLLLSSSVDAAIIWNVKDWSRVRTMAAGAGIVQVRILS